MNRRTEHEHHPSSIAPNSSRVLEGRRLARLCCGRLVVFGVKNRIGSRAEEFLDKVWCVVAQTKAPNSTGG